MIDSGGALVPFAATSQTPIDIAGLGKWGTVANAVYNNRSVPISFATATGGASDKLFIPIGSNLFFGRAAGWFNGYNIEAVLANVKMDI